MNSSIEVRPDHKVDEFAMLTNGNIKDKTRPILAIKRQARKILLSFLYLAPSECKWFFPWPMAGNLNRVDSENYNNHDSRCILIIKKGFL
jgi:hypothetical protein